MNNSELSSEIFQDVKEIAEESELCYDYCVQDCRTKQNRILQEEARYGRK